MSTTEAATSDGLVLDGVVTAYGAVRALDGVSLSVPNGRITAVLGANGAGKTTLLRTINGLVRPSVGSITYDGHNLVSAKVEDVVTFGLAHVPEGRGVITELTVEENLRLGALWRGDRRECAASIEQVYEMFPPLAQRRTKEADTLSGGERQMLAIGRALMSRPSLLLLDEPSLGLAPRVTAQIMATLKRLSQEQGLTVVLVEQNARSALSVADTAVVLNLGKVVVEGSADELAADEKLRHAYLGF
jgi:branched-chain amino acid transport system ATP-binding protein